MNVVAEMVRAAIVLLAGIRTLNHLQAAAVWRLIGCAVAVCAAITRTEYLMHGTTPSMNRRTRLLSAIIGALFVLIATPLATASGTAATSPPLPERYLVEDLGTFGGELANAFGINEDGEVVGRAEVPDTNIKGFLWRAGNLIDIGALNTFGTGTTARAINNRGEIVGDSMAPDPAFPGALSAAPFYWSEASGMLRIGDDGPYGFGLSHDINDAGTVVGNWRNRAFTWSLAEGYSELPLLPDALFENAEALAINDAGAIAGWAHDHDGWTKPVRWSVAGAIEELPTLGAPYGRVDDLNESGVAVGEAAKPIGGGSLPRPVLWGADGSVTEIPLIEDGALQLNSGRVDAINDLGVAVGSDSSSVPGDGRQIGWVRSASGTKLRLNDLINPDTGWDIRVPLDINNAGQIVGIGNLLQDGITLPGRAFRMTPQAAWVDLDVRANRERGTWYADLSWETGGDVGSTLTVYRDGVEIGQVSDGTSYRDLLGRPKRGDTFVYSVCFNGSSTCSLDVPMTVLSGRP